MLTLGLLAPAGCNVIGAAMQKMPKPDIEAAYKGLAGQKVGVMVYADKSLLIDWPPLQLDLANSIDHKLRQAQKEKTEELEGATFPYQPASFIKYQREHPEIEAMPISDVAPKLGVTRLIYVEVNNFSTRANESTVLFLGHMDVNLKVVAIENGVGKVVYEEPNIRVRYPRHATREGELDKGDRNMYVGTLNEISTEVAVRFFKHPDDSVYSEEADKERR